MSLCYEFQKWTIISLTSVTITLIIGLVTLAYGYIDPEKYSDDPDMVDQIEQVNDWEAQVNYCYLHADRPNPLQDLRDKGLGGVLGGVLANDCLQAKRLYDEQLDWLNKMLVDYNKELENKTK